MEVVNLYMQTSCPQWSKLKLRHNVLPFPRSKLVVDKGLGHILSHAGEAGEDDVLEIKALSATASVFLCADSCFKQYTIIIIIFNVDGLANSLIFFSFLFWTIVSFVSSLFYLSNFLQIALFVTWPRGALAIKTTLIILIYLKWCKNSTAAKKYSTSKEALEQEASILNKARSLRLWTPKFSRMLPRRGCSHQEAHVDPIRMQPCFYFSTHDSGKFKFSEQTIQGAMGCNYSLYKSFCHWRGL